jgi:hypothetical protein
MLGVEGDEKEGCTAALSHSRADGRDNRFAAATVASGTD